MGLLDDLIGQVAGGVPPERSAPGAQANAGASMGTILAALTPIVLAMLSNGVRGGQPGRGATPAGGGLADVLGQVLGAGRGTSGMGGLGDLLEQFQRAGFGDQTRSWVGTGQNMPLPPGALEQVLGRGNLAEIARMAGLSEADTSRGLTQLIPEVVDRVTPAGEVPDGTSLLASVDDLSRRLGLG